MTTLDPPLEVPRGQPTPIYSVVIPCYRSERTLPELIPRIESVLEGMREDYEIIFVDDGSPDDASGVIREALQRNPRIRLIQHSRNHGQHHALLTGLHHVRGEYVITMDDDLQHPPEEIPRLVAEMGDADVVMGVPDSRQHKAHRNAGSYLVQRITRFVFRPPEGFTSSAFRLMRAQVAHRLAASPTVYPFLSGMILQVTENLKSVPVRHDVRKHGRSTYTWGRLLNLTSNLIINYTKIPLQILVVTGIVISLLSFFVILYVVVSKLFLREFQAGWPSLIVVISFFGGLNLVGFAVLGEYLIRLLNEVEGTKKPVFWEVRGDAGR